MNKAALLQQIMTTLERDHRLLLQAAKSSHAAATHEDNVPDSKYETLALEASYIAQGQANRAQEISASITAYRQLQLQTFTDQSAIHLSALVQLEDAEGRQRSVFLGPAAGGLRLQLEGKEVVIVTPESPIGALLIGLQCGDEFELEGAVKREFEIIDVC